MPSVPMLNRPQVAPNVRRAIDVPVESTGAGAAAMGLSVAADAFQKERERAGQIRANAAEAEIRQVSSRLATEVERMQRTQALGAEDFVAEKWGTEVSRITAGISDPAVRQAVEARASILRDELQGRARTHASRESERVRTESFEANQTGDLNTLATTPLGEAEGIVERMRLRTREEAEAQGMPPEVIALQVQQTASKARFAQATALIRSERTDEAVAFLQREDVRRDMLPEDLAKAEQGAEAANLATRAQRSADEIVAQFPSNERAALAEARKLTGALRDQVEARVERRFAGERRLTQQAIESRAQSIAQRIEAGGEMTAADEAWLAGQSPDLARSLRKRAEQKAKGVPAVTDYQTLFELYSMTPEARRDVNPFAYQDKLDEGDFQWLLGEVASLRGGGKTTAEERGGYTPPQIDLMAFSRAREMGYIAGSVATMAGLKDNARERAKFDAIRTSIFEAINTARTNAGPNARLTKREIDEVVQGVLDDAVIENPSGMEGDRMMPRAAAPTGRTPTAADSVTFGIRPRPAPVATRKPFATRAQELAAQGKSVRDIARIMEGEGYTIPTGTP